jgi:hypothetical protein
MARKGPKPRWDFSRLGGKRYIEVSPELELVLRQAASRYNKYADNPVVVGVHNGRKGRTIRAVAT